MVKQTPPAAGPTNAPGRGSLESLAGELPPPLRLAVAYAPGAARPAWTALLVLDRRLERTVLAASEPIVAQIKLAWWRERFASPAERWPVGEPLLAALRPWDGERGALGGLVDGWEGLVGGAPTPAEIDGLATARGAAFAALARLLHVPASAAEAERIGIAWSGGDLSRRLGLGTTRAPDEPRRRLPRELRPLIVLRELAQGGDQGLGTMARIVRLGLLGR